MPNQTPVQLAWVTNDVDATEKALTATLGARTWVRMPDVHFAPDACTYLGEPADFTAHVSFSYAGDTQLEVIEPVTGRSPYSDFLAQFGAGMHHVCLTAPDPDAFEAMVADAGRDGVEVIGRGAMAGGMRFAYLAATDAGVPCVEVAYVPPGVQSFFDHVKQEQS